MTDAPCFRLLADYYTHKELLRPPPEIIPRIVWESRSGLLAGIEKSGKSTLLANAIAARYRGGQFLDGHPRKGLTLWVAIDEPVGDLVRRLHELGVPGEAVRISETRPTSDELRQEIRTTGADWVVVDCLTSFAQGIVTDSKSPTEWQLLFQPFNAILRETKAGATVIHHTIRDGTRYADSREIGAAVDVILEMQISKRDDTVREIRARGRIRLERFSVRYVDGQYQLEAGELNIEMRTYRAIQAHPRGIGAKSLRDAVGGRKTHVDAALLDLISKGAVRDVGTTAAHAYVITNPRTENGPGLWGEPQNAGQPSGQGGLVQAQSVVGQCGATHGQGSGAGTLARSLEQGTGARGGLQNAFVPGDAYEGPEPAA